MCERGCKGRGWKRKRGRPPNAKQIKKKSGGSFHKREAELLGLGAGFIENQSMMRSAWARAWPRHGVEPRFSSEAAK